MELVFKASHQRRKIPTSGGAINSQSSGEMMMCKKKFTPHMGAGPITKSAIITARKLYPKI